MSATIKILTVIYIFIIAGIIVLAGYKGTDYLLSFVGEIPFGDKFGHFFLMGIFSFLVNLVFQARTIQICKFKYLLGTLIVLGIITVEELSQILIERRTFDWGDLAADYLGVFLFGELARFIYRKYLIK